jgi:hypothetical protein
VLLVLGALKSNRWKYCEKNMCARFEVGYLSSMWAFQRKLLFSRYIAWCLVGLERLVVDLGGSRGFKNRNVRNPKKSRKIDILYPDSMLLCEF